MKYVKKPIICLLFVLSCLLVACSQAVSEDEKNLSELYERNLKDVTKITILDGTTGSKKTITDKTVIQDFINDIKYIKFILDKNQENKEGFRYSITFFQDEEEPFSFSLTHVDGRYYHTKPDIFPIVDNFYKDLPLKE